MALTPLLPSVRRPQKLDSDRRSRFFATSFLLKKGQLAAPVSTLALYASMVLGVIAICPPAYSAQAVAAGPNTVPLAPQDSRKGLLLDWAGLQVVSISFEGVSESLLKPLPSQLAQQAGRSSGPGQGARESAQPLRHRPLRNHRSGRSPRRQQCLHHLHRRPAPLCRPRQRGRRERRSPRRRAAERHPAPGGNSLF